MEQSPSWVSNQFAASQEFPRILWNPKVHYRVRRARHLSLSWARSVQSMPLHPTSWRSILIISSHLRLGLSSAIRFPYQNPVCAVCATCPAHLILPDLMTLIILGEEYKSLSSSLYSLLPSPDMSSLLSPNILLCTLFSNTLSLRSSLKVIDKVSHLYIEQEKLHFSISWSLYFQIANWKTKTSAPNDR